MWANKTTKKHQYFEKHNTALLFSFFVNHQKFLIAFSFYYLTIKRSSHYRKTSCFINEADSGTYLRQLILQQKSDQSEELITTTSMTISVKKYSRVEA
jgi:predicted nucleotidyltransferase